jgi:hypothetical protein
MIHGVTMENTRKVYVSVTCTDALPYEEQNEHRACIRLIENKVNERMPFEVSLSCRKYDCSFFPSLTVFM